MTPEDDELHDVDGTALHRTLHGDSPMMGTWWCDRRRCPTCRKRTTHMGTGDLYLRPSLNRAADARQAFVQTLLEEAA